MQTYANEWDHVMWRILQRQMPDSAAAESEAEVFKREWTAGCEKWLARHVIARIAVLDHSAAGACVDWLRTQQSGAPDEQWHYTGREPVPTAEFLERLDRYTRLWSRTRILGLGPAEELDTFREEIARLPEDSDQRQVMEAIGVLAQAMRSPDRAAEGVAERFDALGSLGRWVVDEVAWRLWLMDPDSLVRWLNRMSERSIGISGTMALLILDRALRDPSSTALGRTRWVAEQLWREGQGWACLGIRMILYALPAASHAIRNDLVRIIAEMLDRLDIRPPHTQRWLSEFRDELVSAVQVNGLSPVVPLVERVDRLLASGHGRE